MLQNERDAAAWLVLLHQLPARPSSLRVRVWRRLQSIGAVPLRNAAYVLPNRPEPREDLAWVAADVRALGGQATLLAAATLGEDDDAELEAAFREARAQDYRELASEARRLLASAARDRPSPATLASADARLRLEADRLARITYFDPPERKEAREMLERLKSKLRPAMPAAGGGERAAARARGPFRGRTWVTRPRPGIDRMASAWLIRSYVDPRARFTFSERPTAGAIPFDMYEGEFSHQGGACTFEVLARRFGVKEAAVRWLGRVVHDVDLREERYAEPEAPGVALAVEGLRARHESDAELLEAGIALFAALAHGRAAPRVKATKARSSRRNRKRRGRIVAER
jgi:hypothetical protein